MRGHDWRLFSPLLSHMATTLTGRREEVDSECQVLNVWINRRGEDRQDLEASHRWMDGLKDSYATEIAVVSYLSVYP